MRITLTNNFHGTSIDIVCDGRTLSVAQVRRARKALCGIAGCKCGGDCGERGEDGFTIAVNPSTGRGEIY